MVKIHQLRKNIIHLRFENQYIMNLSLARPTEFTESRFPNLKGKAFTWTEFMEEYVRILGNFEYLGQILGHNFPGESMVPFIEGRFDPLSKSEQKVVSMLKDRDVEKQYIIGTFRDNDFNHEFAHALFEMIPSYRKKVRSVLKTLSVKDRNRLEDHLRGMEYHPDSWPTESNSYMVDRSFGCPQEREIARLFKEYANGNGKKTHA